MNKHIMKHIRAHFIFGAQTYRETGTHTVPPLVWRGLTQCHHLILRDPDQQSTSFIKYQPLTTPGKGATTPNQSRGESQETAPIRGHTKQQVGSLRSNRRRASTQRRAWPIPRTPSRGKVRRRP